MAEKHAVSRGKRQSVARRLLPRQMFGTRHQLLGLHIGKLRERPIRRLISPNPLAGGEHRIPTITFLIVAVVLIAMDNNLIPNFPAFDLVTDSPNDPGGVRSCDMVILPMAIKRADRDAKPGPNAVIIYASRHHENQNLLAIEHRRIHNLNLKCLVRLAVAFTANGPSIHFRWHMTHRGNFTHRVQIFYGRVRLHSWGMSVQSHTTSLCVKCRSAELVPSGCSICKIFGAILQPKIELFCNFMSL